MTGPLQPIGPQSSDTRVVPLARPQQTGRRRERDDDEPRERKDRQGEEQGSGPTPDADGHIDVLA